MRMCVCMCVCNIECSKKETCRNLQTAHKWTTTSPSSYFVRASVGIFMSTSSSKCIWDCLLAIDLWQLIKSYSYRFYLSLQYYTRLFSISLSHSSRIKVCARIKVKIVSPNQIRKSNLWLLLVYVHMHIELCNARSTLTYAMAIKWSTPDNLHRTLNVSFTFRVVLSECIATKKRERETNYSPSLWKW